MEYYYFTEKTISSKEFNSEKSSYKDTKCMFIGQKLANKFDLIFNGWWETTYTFTIPAGVPNEKNTFMAHNEKEIIDKLQKRFPDYLEYIINKNFPDGYEPDLSIPMKPPIECEPIEFEYKGKE